MAKKQRKATGASPGASSGKPKHSLDSNRASKADLGKRDAATVSRRRPPRAAAAAGPPAAAR
jgi:hypothetical protein